MIRQSIAVGKVLQTVASQIMTRFTWAAKQLHSHRDPTVPRLRMKSDMNSYKSGVNLVDNDSVRIRVAKKYLNALI